MDAPSNPKPLEQIQPLQPGLSTHAMSSAREAPIPQQKIPAVQRKTVPSICQISYIFCSDDVLTVTCKKRSLLIDLEKESMEFLARLILANENLPNDSTSIELFTHEGYPIVLNDYNREGEKMLCMFLIYNYY